MAVYEKTRYGFACDRCAAPIGPECETRTDVALALATAVQRAAAFPQKQNEDITQSRVLCLRCHMVETESHETKVMRGRQ